MKSLKNRQVSSGTVAVIFFSLTVVILLPLILSVQSIKAEKKDEKLTVYGRVVKDDKPVSRAKVYLYIPSEKYDPDEQAKVVAKTKRDGSFAFAFDSSKLNDRRSAGMQLVVFKRGCSIGWVRLSKDMDLENISIELDEPDMVSGIVKDRNDNPIKGAEAKVRFLQIGDPFGGNWLWGRIIPELIKKTNRHGEFVFNSLSEGSIIGLDIIGRGYARQYESQIAAGSRELSFILVPEGRIEGRIIYSDTGKPAKNVDVMTQALERGSGLSKAITNGKGKYSITNLSPGQYNVFIEDLPEWTAVAKEHVTVEEGKTTSGIDLFLVKGGFITGRVTEKETGKPIPNWGISFYDAARPESQAAVHGVHTDENGFYRFRTAPGKALVYTYSSPMNGYIVDYTMKKYVDVEEDKTVSGVDFQLKKGIEIKGKVLSSDGQPVSCVIITGNRWSRGGPDYQNWNGFVTSGKNGTFIISGLEEEKTLTLFAEHKKLALKGYTSFKPKPSTEIIINIEKYDTASLEGRIVDEEGNPMAGVQMWLSVSTKGARGGTNSVAAVTVNSGTYRITDLTVGGQEQYSNLTAKMEGFADTKVSLGQITAGLNHLNDAVMNKANRWIEGIISDIEGNPVIGARLTINEPSGFKMAVTDSKGHYRIDSLAPVIVSRLVIHHQENGYYEFRYVETNKTHDFTLLKPKYYLAGRVVNKEGKPIIGAHVGGYGDQRYESGFLFMGSLTNSQGRFRIEHILEETVSLGVSHENIGYRSFHNIKTNRDSLILVFEVEKVKQSSGREEKTPTWEFSNKGIVILEGKPAPEFTVSEWLNGDPVTFTELKGKMVVLDFWSFYEKSCVEALRMMNALAKGYNDRNVVFIGVHEYTDDLDSLKKCIEENELTYRIAIDTKSPEENSKGMTFDSYGLSRYSMNVIVKLDGTVVTDVHDSIIESEIMELIRQEVKK